MSISKEAKKYSIIAGVLFIVLSIFGLIYSLTANLYPVNQLFLTGRVLLGIGFGIVLLIGKKNISYLILLAINIVFMIPGLITGLLYNYFKYFGIVDFIGIISYIVLFFVFFLAIKNIKINKLVYFIPTGLLVMNFFVNILVLLYMHYTYFGSILGIIRAVASFYTLLKIVEIAGFLFIGLTLSVDHATKLSTEGIPSAKNQNIKKQASRVYQNPDKAFVGKADKIRMYKDLLDSGAITQEEFEKKKNELLA